MAAGLAEGCRSFENLPLNSAVCLHLLFTPTGIKCKTLYSRHRPAAKRGAPRILNRSRFSLVVYKVTHTISWYSVSFGTFCPFAKYFALIARIWILSLNPPCSQHNNNSRRRIQQGRFSYRSNLAHCSDYHLMFLFFTHSDNIQISFRYEFY